MVHKKRLDALIPEAIRIVDRSDMKDKDGRIHKTFHGYISSFGAMMALSGPLAAAVVFEAKPEGGAKGPEKQRHFIPKAVLDVMKKDEAAGIATGEELLSKLLRSKLDGQHTRLTRKDLQSLAVACIAVKLAMRTFPKTGENE